MSNANLNYGLYEMLEIGEQFVNDPGASGTISFQQKAIACCNVETAGAESRAIFDPAKDSETQRLLVVYKSGSGDLTITDHDASTLVVLTAPGQAAEFVVIDNDGTKEWALVASAVAAGQFVGLDGTDSGDFAAAGLVLQSSGAQTAEDSAVETADLVTAAAAFTAGFTPVAGGADKTLVDPTPVALGTVTINTGDAGSDGVIVAIANALIAVGICSGTID